MKYANWKVPESAPAVPSALLKDGCTPLLAAILQLRGLESPDAAKEFLRGDTELLTDPMAILGMDRAVRRLKEAIEKREHVAVYGDYDVDGITSTCLLTDYLCSCGLPCDAYIPDRLREGYGLNSAAVDFLSSQGVTLIVTVDCGVTNINEAEHAAAIGMDMIITDHHECHIDSETGCGILPKAVAVVNPKVPGNTCGKTLAGVGVAFKLACAMSGKPREILDRYCDLVAVGTVADVMLLQGENRFITRCGLKKITDGRCRTGFLALAEAAGVHGKTFTASTVGFSLAPRINAAGRLGDPLTALELLQETDPKRAEDLSEKLCDMNGRRKDFESAIWAKAEQQVQQLYNGKPDTPIVLADKIWSREEPDGWHAGVIGIVASRLTDKYSVPAVMICLDGDTGKGSCRSVGDFNIFEALSACSDCLEGFGGHAMAAGVTVRRDRVDELRERLRDYYLAHPNRVVPALEADVLIDRAEFLTQECVQSLDLLEPCGNGNPRPLFYMDDVLLDSVQPIGSGKHLRLRIRKFDQMYDAVFFSQTESTLGARKGSRCDIVFVPQINNFRNVTSVQLVLTDLRRHSDAKN